MKLRMIKFLLTQLLLLIVVAVKVSALRSLQDVTPVISTGTEPSKGLYKKVIFLFLSGVDLNDIENVSSKVRLFNARKKSILPNMMAIRSIRIREPLNCFYARVSSSSVQQDQHKLIKTLMNGYNQEKLAQEMFLGNPQANRDYVKDSLIDQIISKRSKQHQAHLKFQYIFKQLEFTSNDLQLHTNKTQPSKNELQAEYNLSPIQECISQSECHHLIIYDDTIARVKLLYGEDSQKVQEVFTNYNGFISNIINNVQEETLLVLMGSFNRYSKSKTNQFKSPFNPFFFSYSKMGFAKTNLLLRDKQREKYEKSEAINWIDENDIASTLALAIGLDVPIHNSGRTIFEIYPAQKDIHNHSELLNQFFQDSLNALSQQMRFFSYLKNEFNLFSSVVDIAVKQKYQQIEIEQSHILLSIEQLNQLEKQITKQSSNQLQLNPNNTQLHLQKQKQDIEITIYNYISKVIDLQQTVIRFLDGKKQISIQVYLISFIFGFMIFIGCLRVFLREIHSSLSINKSKINYTIWQIAFILPVSLIGYFYFYFSNINYINYTAVLVCLALSSCLFCFELFVILKQTLSVKLFLTISALVLACNSVQSQNYDTLGFVSHIFLRLRFSQSNPLLWTLQNVLFITVLLILSAIRLLSFNAKSPIIDFAILLIVLTKKGLSTCNKICYIVLILTQYSFNFCYTFEEQVHSYLIFGCSLFILTLVQEAYEVVTLSFNKLFIYNMTLYIFQSTLLELKLQTYCCDYLTTILVYLLPSFTILVTIHNYSELTTKQTVISQTTLLQSKFCYNIDVINAQKSDMSLNKCNSLSYCEQETSNCFTMYSLIGILQFTIIVVILVTVFSDQLNLHSILIYHSPIGLIFYSFTQNIAVLLSIFLTSQMYKATSYSSMCKSQDTYCPSQKFTFNQIQ